MIVAGVGVLVVAVYATLLVVVQLVLDPLAAVPGTPLGAIYDHLEQQGFDTCGDVVAVVVTASVGVVLAVVVAVVTVWRRVGSHFVTAWMLGLVAAGAVPFFVTGFQLGMDVADGYGVSGAAHTPWAGVLYLVSLAALVAVPVVLVVGERRRALRLHRPTPPTPAV
jgi:hypothetical protein